MFKRLFSIIMILVGIAASAHTDHVQVLNTDFALTVSSDSSGEVYESSMSHKVFFDVQSEDFSVSSNTNTKPSTQDETSVNKDGKNFRSLYIAILQRQAYVLAERSSFKNFHLRKTLYPFHSFW